MNIKNFIEALDLLPLDYRVGNNTLAYNLAEINDDSGDLWEVTEAELEYIKVAFKEEFENLWTVSESMPIDPNF